MSNKEVAHQIINFLKTAVQNKEINEDFVDSIDVAIDCVADAFEVDKDEDEKTVKTAFNGKTLKEILSAAQSAASTPSPEVATEVPVHVDEVDEVDEDTKRKAEELKTFGNKAMAAKDFDEAISKYTEAIELTPKNKIYLSNRAAAYSSKREHEKAIADAKAAIEIDPSYPKAYSRLGLAHYALGQPKEAMDAYKKGMEVEGDAPSSAMKNGYETAKARVEESLNVAVEEAAPAARDAPAAGAGAGAGGMPDLANLANMFGGAGGAGGMPDLGSMMNNPMIAQAAQRMMQNPNMLNDLMSNPSIRDMASQMQNGGGMPDLGSLMSNPALRDMASQFMGGMGGNANAGGNGQQ